MNAWSPWQLDQLSEAFVHPLQTPSSAKKKTSKLFLLPWVTSTQSLEAGLPGSIDFAQTARRIAVTPWRFWGNKKVQMQDRPLVHTCTNWCEPEKKTTSNKLKEFKQTRGKGVRPWPPCFAILTRKSWLFYCLTLKLAETIDFRKIC